MKEIGLALSGGGAKGIAHIAMLEVFDELGLKPDCIAGTSVGAIFGALYASGMTGHEIRALAQDMIITENDSFLDSLKKKDIFRWIKFMDIEFGRSALFKGDKIVDFLCDSMGVSTFEELQIPLRVVATDFWNSEQVVFDSGDLHTAIKASMGLPGIFRPVVWNERVLIDGGGVNPVPHDLLLDCDLVVAIDVMGGVLDTEHTKIPSLARAVFRTFDVMQNSIIAQRKKISPPDIYIKPEICNVDMLEFFKVEEVLLQSKPASEKLKKRLSALRGISQNREGLISRLGRKILGTRNP